MAARQEYVANVFRTFDSKGTGAISKQQFVKTLEYLEPGRGRADAEVALRVSGTCAHGLVAYEEFCKWLWHPSPTGRGFKAKAPGLRQLPVRRHKEESEALGVSVAHLRDAFLAEVQVACASGIDADYREISRTMLHGPNGTGCGFVCPRDGAAHCSYVDTLPVADASQANVMLSYCWSCSARTIVNALSRWCRQDGRDPATVFAWQDALCCNLYRAEARRALGECEAHGPFQELFERRLRNAGLVLAIVTPWREPLYTSRMWCVFEMYTALREEGCSVDIVMPEEDESSFIGDLGHDSFQHMWRRRTMINVERAKVSCAVDRVNILRCIDPDATDSSRLAKCAELNTQVTQRLRRWFADVAVQHAEAQLRKSAAKRRASSAAAAATDAPAAVNADLQFGNVARLLTEVGDFTKAQQLIEAALEQHTGASGIGWRGPLLASLGECFERQGYAKDAVDAYQQAKTAFEAAGRTQSPPYAFVLKSIGLLRAAQGGNSQAALLYKDARVILETAGATASIEYASLLRIMGASLATQGRNDESMDLYRKAKVGYEAADAMDVPGYAALLVMMGSRHAKEGRAIDALAMFGQAKAAFETMATTLHPNYGDVLLNIANCHQQQGHLPEALAHFTHAKMVYETAGARGRPQYAQVLKGLQSCQDIS